MLRLNFLTSKLAARYAVLALTWLAFLLRTLTLSGQSLWRDEVDAIVFSGWHYRDLVQGLIQAGHNGPLYFLLLRPWQDLLGISEFAIRYPSAMLGSVAVPLGYVLARQFRFSRRTGLLLSLLLATSPYLVWYSQEAKMYTMLLATVMLALLAYLKALSNRGKGWWIIFVVMTTLSFYLHIMAPLMLLVYGVIALLFWPGTRRHWRGWLASMICLTLPYLPLVVWQFSFFWSGMDRGHPFYPLHQQTELLLKLYSSGLLRFIGASGIVLFLFPLLSGLFLTNVRTKAEHLTLQRRLALAAWLILPPLAIYLISLRVPVFEDRYLIYITPAFYLLVALGIVLIRQHAAWLAALCLGLILVVNLTGIWQQQRQAIKPNFRAAAQYLLSQPTQPATIMIQIPYLERTFNYYYPQPYTFLAGPWTNNGKSNLELHQEMISMTTNTTDLWLVVSEESLWDRRRLTRSWLDEHASLIKKENFMRVDVYHYRIQPGSIDSQSILMQ